MTTDTKPKKKSSGKRMVVYLILLIIIVAFSGGYLLGTGNLSGLGDNPLNPETFVRLQRDHVLRPEDLDSGYSLIAGGDSPWTNEEVVQLMGSSDGKRYVTETGRVDGWQSGLEKNNSSAFGPETYTTRIQIFETKSGAGDSLESSWYWKYTLKEELNDTFSEDTCSIGSDCITAFFDYYYPESDLVKVRYDVAFRIDNVTVWVSIKGLDVDTTLDDALDAAQSLYDKLNDLK